jgi:hypothetical protein
MACKTQLIFVCINLIDVMKFKSGGGMCTCVQLVILVHTAVHRAKTE